jgi:predicted DNA-binding protein with PD1-like motif
MQAKKVECGYFLRIDKDEEIISSILKFVSDEKIQAGTVAGIGALTEVTLGYFDRQAKKYKKRIFNDVYELLSLSGSISYIGEGPIVHAHCILGDIGYNVIGGHLFSGIVAVTAEIYIRTFADKLNREMNKELSLNLLVF